MTKKVNLKPSTVLKIRAGDISSAPDAEGWYYTELIDMGQMMLVPVLVSRDGSRRPELLEAFEYEASG